VGWKSLAVLVGLVSGADAPPEAIRYLALGDSFTIGTSTPENLNFPSQLAALARKRGRTVRLENVAVNGYSTKEIIRDELPALDVVKPTHVTLAVGANDIVRGSGPTEYRTRLKQIFAKLSAAGLSGNRLLVIPQPDWSQAPIAEAFGDRDELRGRIETYNGILAEETKVAGGVYVDLWPLMMEQGTKKLFASDGLHPNQKAYTAWAQALVERFDSR